MHQKLIVTSIFTIYAVIALAKPEWIGQWQTWTNKKLLGAEFKPCQRTFNYYRLMGVMFALIAASLFFGFLK